jgi:hypothetical protein
MKERRPIFIIRLPKGTSEGDYLVAKESLERYEALYKDYHVLLIAGNQNIQTEFECYGHTLTDIELDELNQKVLKQYEG